MDAATEDQSRPLQTVTKVVTALTLVLLNSFENNKDK